MEPEENVEIDAEHNALAWSRLGHSAFDYNDIATLKDRSEWWNDEHDSSV